MDEGVLMKNFNN